MPDHRLRALCSELSEDEEQLILGEPDSIVPTMLHPGDGAARELHIYYHGDTTYVSESGAYQNGDPWKLQGRHEPEEVLDFYLWSLDQF